MSQATMPPAGPPKPAPRERTPDPIEQSRLPPQDLEAEMSLLGAMLLDRECIGLVLQIISREESERFYVPSHRILFQTLVDMYDNNGVIDFVTLRDELTRRKKLEEVGGDGYLITLCESVPCAANSEYYARIVRDKGLLRDLIRCAGRITEMAYAQGEPAADILDQAEKQLFDVAEQRVSNQALPIKDLIQQTWEIIQSRRVVRGVPTAFRDLDEMLGGFQYGDLVVVAARPSMGKTAIALSMLDCIGIDERVPAAFFSLEMSKLQITQRMLCSRAKVQMGRLRTAKLTDEQINSVAYVMDDMRDAAIFVDDTPGMSVMEVRAKARRLKMLHNIQVVFVDYLQLMWDRAGSESRQQEIASISRGLKALARELSIPIVALAQLNRQVEGRTGNRPRMSDLRESGAIEQDADVVILLHREEYYCPDKKNVPEELKGKAELIVEKQRNGPTGVVELHFTPEFMRFDDAAAEYLRDEGEFTASTRRDEYAAADPGTFEPGRRAPQRGPEPVPFDPEGPGLRDDASDAPPFTPDEEAPY